MSAVDRVLTRYPFPLPIDPKLSCGNCGSPIVAVASIHEQGALGVAGLREYEWVHRDGPQASPRCAPPDPPPTAKPYDAWEATRRVTAIEKARSRAADAYLDEIEGLPWSPDELFLHPSEVSS